MSKMTTVVFLMNLLLCFQATTAYLIEPGMGLIQQPQTKASSSSTPFSAPLEIVIFEHTDVAGTGGLVLNCPTPLQLGNIAIPRFRAFEKLPLMLGCVDSSPEEEDLLQSASSLPLGNLSPWFWLHDMDGIRGSYALEGAAGPLFMGGDLDEATEQIRKYNIDPAGRFKFFRKYKLWKTGELEEQLEQGLWKMVPQNPARALEAVKSGVPSMPSNS
jgi:hypothetical protein